MSGEAQRGHFERPAECTCTDFCPESDNPCIYCRKLDVYDPCPVIGFGCGTGGVIKPGDLNHDSDCCTDAQLLAAAGNA